MNDLVQVIFRAFSAPFNAGEIAAVAPARAAALISAGVADAYVDAEATKLRKKPAPEAQAAPAPVVASPEAAKPVAQPTAEPKADAPIVDTKAV